MKATHTPGPWITDSVNGDYPHDIILGYQIPGAGFPVLVATVFADECEGPGRMTAEADANARLIASAPDLLEALEHLIRFCPQPEMEQTHYDEEPSYVSAEAAALAETIFRAQSAIAAARGE